jgi:hypothetical protein
LGDREELSDLVCGEIIEAIDKAEDEEDEDPLIVIFIVDELDLTRMTIFAGVVLPKEVKGINFEHLIFMHVDCLEDIPVNNHRN